MSIQKICAGFETTLSAKILAAGMSFSLSTHVNKTGAELAGEYGFILDEGTSTEEWGYGTILNGVVTVIKRGCDPEDPETEVTALKFDHSRGSSVKITDYPFLGFVKKYLGGEKGLPMPLKYATHQVPAADEELVDKKYVADIMSGTIGTANPSIAGTMKTTHNQGTNTRAMSTLVRAQDTPNMTLLVGAYKHSEIDKNISFSGGNSPAFVNPDFSGDLIITTNPSNAETFTITINGTVCNFTFVSTIGATPGNVLIGASAAATRANLVALINTPGTSTANGVAFTGAQLTALSLISSVDDLATDVFIKSISTTLTTLTASETMAAVGNTWAINTTKKRIDLLVLQISDSTLQIRRGVENVTPVAPTPTSGDIVLAQVYLVPGMTCIKDVTDGVNGYILAWYFPNIYQLPDSPIITAGESISAGDLLKMSLDLNANPVAKKLIGISSPMTAINSYNDNFNCSFLFFVQLTETRSVFIYLGSPQNSNHSVRAVCSERQTDGTYLFGSDYVIKNYAVVNSERTYIFAKRVDDNSFMISSYSGDSGVYGTELQICSIANRVITAGTPTNLGATSSAITYCLDALNIGSNNWLFLIYGPTASASQSKVICGQINSTTRVVTVGTGFDLGLSITDTNARLVQLNATEAMVSYTTKYRIFTFNTTTNAISSSYTEQTNPITGTVFRFVPSNVDNIGLVTYLDGNTYASVAKYTRSAGTFTVSGTKTLTSGVASSTSLWMFDPDLYIYLYVYTVGGIVKIKKILILGGNLNCLLERTSPVTVSAVYGKQKIYGISITLTQYPSAGSVLGILQVASPDYEQYVFIAQSAASLGTVVTQKQIGQIYTTSGLITGEIYYVGQQGSITTESVSIINGVSFNNDILGIAVSPTKLLLKK